MATIEQLGFEPTKTKKALEMLLIDRKNEFRELCDVIFSNIPTSKRPDDSDKFILDFSLEVNEAFKTWSGQEPLTANSALKALTILRQLSRGQKAMVNLGHLLTISNDLAEQFKVIYQRLE